MELKKLSDSFVEFIREKGKDYIKDSWLNNHSGAKDLEILTSKTINDLATGFQKNNNLTLNEEQLTEDLKTLHEGKGLELMDTFENQKKGGNV